jgi:hypothetical protein
MPDDGLYDKTDDGGYQPKIWQFLYVCAKGLKDTAGVPVLKGEPELNAQKPETHVPDLPEGKAWFGNCGGGGIIGHGVTFCWFDYESKCKKVPPKNKNGDYLLKNPRSN